MSNYYDNQEAKVLIMSELVNRGWKVYGYKPNESDSMTDYFSPAHWEGIAEKNGFVLVVDNHGTYYSGYEKREYNYNNKTAVSNNRIKKLQAMMNDEASTENEKASCAVLIEKEKQKAGIEPSYTVIETYPTFQHGNPKRNNWHIEKDGQIIAKGNGAFTVYVSNSHYEPNKSKQKQNVKAFVDRLEATVNGSDAIKAEIVKEAVTVTKPVEIEKKDIVKGDIVKFGSSISFWQVLSVSDRSATFIRLSKKYQPLTMNQTNHHIYSFSSIQKGLSNGSIKVYEMQEITEYVEKTVYKKAVRKPAKMSEDIQIETTEQAQEMQNNEQQAEMVQKHKETEQPAGEVNTSVKSDITVTLNEQFNGIEIRFSSKPEEEVIEQLKAQGFRWSNRQKMWYAKQSQSTLAFAERLNGSQEPTETHNSHNSSEPGEPAQTTYNYPKIDINDIHTYTVSEQLQKAEHDSHWIFRKNGEPNRTEEIQSLLQYYQNQVLEVIEQTDNQRIIYYLKKALQSYKKRYYENFVAKLRNKASNPSWAVTGPANRNARKAEKANSRFDKLMQEGIDLDNYIKSAINRAIRNIAQEEKEMIKETLSKVEVNADFQTVTKEMDIYGYRKKFRTYQYEGYSIVKAWGCFRILYQGKEIDADLKTTDTLETAKRYVIMLLNQQKAV